MKVDLLKDRIRYVPDFPKPGIVFRDITPMLLDPEAFRLVIDMLYARYKSKDISKVVAIESRGFLVAAPISYMLQVGLVPMRKPGKLPHDTTSEPYLLEYGESALEVHNDAIHKGDRVVVFDDLLATGGTAAASVALVKKLGGKVLETCFIIELTGLHGRDRLDGTPVFSLIQDV